MSDLNDTIHQTGKHVSPTPPAKDFEVLLITGMSGAGRSHAANSIEDMGWYVVDNMPPSPLPRKSSTTSTERRTGSVA